MSTAKSLNLPTQNPHFQFHPSQLNAKDRATHVVQSLLAYNQGIIKDNPTGASVKFKRLRKSPFIFMRGTADLMYRDFYGTDADKAMVLCVGDVHLENYGVMEADDGSLIWGINDFDEALFAPFTWDIKRGAISVILATLDIDKKESFGKKETEKLAYDFAKSYIKTIEKGLKKENYDFIFRENNSPDVISELLNESSKIDSEAFIKKHYLNPESPSPIFRNTDKIERVDNAELIQVFQDELNSYLLSLKERNKEAPDSLKVIDLATKIGSGTASIGLWRYYTLVEVLKEGKKELIILEIKQERTSVLVPYVGEGLLTFPSEGSRVVYAENVHLSYANPYYGYTAINGISYLVRERSPHKRRVEMEALTKYKQFKSYVKACGKALALAHLQSDSLLDELNPNLAVSILHSVNLDTFCEEIAGFASKMAEQTIQDWKYFKKAFKQNTFIFD